MWNTNNLWFDLAIVMSIFAVGNILFGHFEEHKAKWRRLLKVIVVAAVVVSLSGTVGRGWAYAVLSLPLIGAVVVHLWWLPSKGINGWTGEPKEKYLELMKAKRG